MSVLSFPRIYFKGMIEWDPCTFNNNDWQDFPTYDGTNAALNWSFLNTQGITGENFQQTFRPWAIKLQKDNNPNDAPPGLRVPAEWNMFGTHGVSFVDHKEEVTGIIGGEIGYNQPVDDDPIIGGRVTISGDGGSGPGRLVDINPASFWSSQVYFGEIAFGGKTIQFSGPRVYRMHSRWLNANRIYNSPPHLTQPAASFACCLQTAIPYAQVTWPSGGPSSQLVTQLQQKAALPDALGIMVRFTAYVNVYFKNGILNDIPVRPRDYVELHHALQDAWSEWTAYGKTSKFFSNPCYSHVVGTVGVWKNGELASVPCGRFLATDTPVLARPPALSAGKPPHGHGTQLAAVAKAVPLGPAAVEIDYGAKLISLDFGSAIPELGVTGEWPSDLEKAHFGPLTLGVVNAQNAFTPVTTIDYSQYDRPSYERRAGIIDIPFPDSGTDTLLQSGTLAIQTEDGTRTHAEPANGFSANTDERGVYLDQGQTAELNVSVFNLGIPSPGASILVAQYDTGGLSLVPAGQELVNLTNGTPSTITVGAVTTRVTVVTADGSGVASVAISAQQPGFPVLAFYPFAGGNVPAPLAGLFPPFVVGSAFYTTIRVLPFDDAAPQAFVDVWNSTKNRDQAWSYVYYNILYVYDMLFSIMVKYVNLGSQKAFADNHKAIWNAIAAAAAAESTYAMPITRDLSAGKRLALQLYIYLIANKFNVPNFSVSSIPPEWSPP